MTVSTRTILVLTGSKLVRYSRSRMGQESGRRPKVDGDPSTVRRASEIPPEDEHQSFNTVVGEGIRRARQERGWTQAFLAEQARLSPNYIARLERGELGPSLFVANRICEALQIDLEVLVGAPSGAGTTPRKSAKRRIVG